MSNRSSEDDHLVLSERVAQILVGQIRAALERRIAPEEVSLVFRETSDLLAEHLRQHGNSVPQNIQDRIEALIIDLRLW